MTGQKQKRNSCYELKAAWRQRISRLLSPDDFVLEVFAGDGHMYRAAWAGHRGACIDKDPLLVAQAVRERPSWACYQANSLRALSGGFPGWVMPAVVDVDCFGEPWPVVEAYLGYGRGHRRSWWLVMSDGYWPQISISSASKAIFPDARGGKIIGMSTDVYLDRCAAWLGARMRVAHFSSSLAQLTRGVGVHVALIGDPPDEWIRSAREWSGAASL